MFLGQYTIQIVDRNTIKLPDRYQEFFEINKCIVFFGPDGSIMLYPEELFDDLFTQIETSKLNLNYESRGLLNLLLRNYSRMQITVDGNISIPDELIELAKIENEVLLLGVGNYIELWNPTSYQEYCQNNNLQVIDKEKHLFLCHSSFDKDFALKLAKDLQERNIKVWLDKWEMLPGDSLYEKIQDGIIETAYFGIILSPNSVESNWCKRELHGALEEENVRKNVFVIPILFKDCDIPVFLKEKLYVDLRQENYEEGLDFLMQRFDINSMERNNQRFIALDLETLPPYDNEKN
jgi:division/cell wall cluster transcriptional repressor MraZ